MSQRKIRRHKPGHNTINQQQRWKCIDHKRKKKLNKTFDIFIKLLLGFYLNDENIEDKKGKNFEKNNQFEICYIFNKNYINKLKEIFNYDEFHKTITKEKFIQKIKEINDINKLIINKEFIEDLKNDLSKTQFVEALSTNIKKNYTI